jgi:hypothetical protein
MRVSRAELTDLEPIGRGGRGHVFSVSHFRLRNDPTALAYKEFISDETTQGVSAQDVVEFRGGLSADERAHLDAMTVWPRAVVEDDGGKVCGLLMPLLPQKFFREMIDSDTGQRAPKPLDFQWLIAKEVTRREAEIDLPDIDRAQRLFLLARLTYVIGWLHKLGWVYGDLSFKNAVFALDPPSVMLIDCDGAAALANRLRLQYSTPFWNPPEVPIKDSAEGATLLDEQPALQSDMSDSYKLGLAILRCLTPGKGASQRRDPSALGDMLDAEGKALIAAALETKPGVRPTAKQLYAYLRKITLPLVAIPVVHDARLVNAFRLRGQSARIDWRIARAARVTIRVGNDEVGDVEYAADESGFDFIADKSGPVSVVASNSYGKVTARIGELTVYELPPFGLDLGALPVPEIRDIDGFTAEPLTAAIMGPPDNRLEFPRVPEIDPPDPLAPLPVLRIDDAVVEVSSAMTELVMNAGTEYLDQLRGMMGGDVG